MTPSSSQFSGLISVYYKEKPEYFQIALESVINQTLVPDEIVIVKDGPLTLDLESVIEDFTSKYPNLFQLVELEKNMGLGIALAKGVEICKYQIIARVDTDDICHPQRFAKQIKVFEENSHIDLVGSWINEFGTDKNDILSVRSLPETHEDIYQLHKKRNALNHMTVVFKKSSVLEVGNYQHMPYFEDYNLWARMMLLNMQFYNIQESLVHARVGNDMLQRRRGYNYLKYEYNHYRLLFKIKFISFFEFCKVFFPRAVVRLLPKYLLNIIYKKLARKIYKDV